MYRSFSSRIRIDSSMYTCISRWYVVITWDAYEWRKSFAFVWFGINLLLILIEWSDDVVSWSYIMCSALSGPDEIHLWQRKYVTFTLLERVTCGGARSFAWTRRRVPFAIIDPTNLNQTRYKTINGKTYKRVKPTNHWKYTANLKSLNNNVAVTFQKRVPSVALCLTGSSSGISLLAEPYVTFIVK